MIYQDPLAYLVGLEGIALLDAWAGDHDREFTETRLADPERFPRLVAAMTQQSAAPPADFADDEFRFGLGTVLDGIACRA